MLEVVCRLISLHIEGSSALQIYRGLFSLLNTEGLFTLIRTHDDQDQSVLTLIYATPTNIKRIFCTEQLRQQMMEMKGKESLRKPWPESLTNKFQFVACMAQNLWVWRAQSGRGTEVRESGDVKISGS